MILHSKPVKYGILGAFGTVDNQPPANEKPAGPEIVAQESGDLEARADKIDRVFAHLWMVRTFVKHAPEVEDFPQLMNVVRAIFDSSRAVEVHRQPPADYLKVVRKKRSKLRLAADQFRVDAPLASDHTNFKMAVRSLDACLLELDELLDR